MMVKKTYQKPRIKQVGLLPEEAVLETCKVNSGDAGPATTCGPGQCKNPGAAS